eukprot:1161470-Pelagomonas_calceolata.AAC.11
MADWAQQPAEELGEAAGDGEQLVEGGHRGDQRVPPPQPLSQQQQPQQTQHQQQPRQQQQQQQKQLQQSIPCPTPVPLVSVRSGCASLAVFTQSLGRFGAPGAFMAPSYGAGSLPEALVRHAAVHGAVTALRWVGAGAHLWMCACVCGGVGVWGEPCASTHMCALSAPMKFHSSLSCQTHVAFSVLSSKAHKKGLKQGRQKWHVICLQRLQAGSGGIGAGAQGATATAAAAAAAAWGGVNASRSKRGATGKHEHSRGESTVYIASSTSRRIRCRLILSFLSCTSTRCGECTSIPCARCWGCCCAGVPDSWGAAAEV